MAEGMTFLTDLDAPEDVRYFSQGHPCSPEDEFRIVGADFEELPEGVEGEVVVRGPYTISRYYRDIPANAECFRDGFYRPGDKGMRLATGDIRITGRVREQINRAGEKVMPSEVEACLLSVPDISECAVVGVADDVLGKAIYAFYRGDRELSLQEVVSFLREQQVEDCCIPDFLRRIDSWPLSAVGKIDRDRLRELAACDDE